jgi:hypothetical protein
LAGQLRGQPGRDRGDLEPVGVDQSQQRVHPAPVDRIQRNALEQGPTGNPEQVRNPQVHALLGQHRVHLRLQPGAQGDQLGPVPHQLTQFAHRRRRDPCLRQAVHPQQVGQIRGVPDVVLDPSIGEALHPQGVHQVHPCALRGEHVGRPVPAIGGLQDHLRIRSSLGDLQAQRDRIVVDPDRLQPLPGRRHPHDHRPASMQINAHELPLRIPFHQGLLRRET